MKTISQIYFAAIITITLSLAGSAKAQLRSGQDDGIAASPKVRQMLNERKASLEASKNDSSKTPPSAGFRALGTDGIAASPRTRQALDEHARNTAAISSSTGVASAGYQATGADGITASPKLRQQLDERPQPIIVAPVK